ncbi:hypothetical protein B0T16DRAFT_113368 [Cercophora newfieldiana]|uniref:Uncharacterized protein n=1 Tax=Cercophora newfieldiana TaxID=92897 RepID=A0AA39Y8U3_9PEZI|nr:hypothetical protein B0T16DRAFT_113368 [Cercophora newfieldiana]
MSDPQVASPDVYIGAWWSYVNGNKPTLVLTLRDGEALILVSALVIFTGFVATRVFGAVQFILHQARAERNSSPGIVSNRRTRTGPDRHSRDTFHGQQQTLLRNAAGHAQTLWLAVRVAWGWRGRIGVLTAFRRSLAILVVTLVSLAAWTAAQLLLPLLWTTSTDQMLSAPGSCSQAVPPYRQPQGNPERSIEATDAFSAYYRGRAEAAANYQRHCPGNDTANPQCQRIPFQRISWTVTQKCPVLDCVTGFANSDPIHLGTGYINSNTHFGVNAPLEDTIDFQHTMSCVSMNPNRVDLVQYDQPTNGTSGVYRYLYGNTTIGNTTLPYTTTYNESSIQSGGSYEIISFTNYTNHTSPTLWSPTPLLFEPNSESDSLCTIHFLASHSLTYSSPVMDPLFQTSPFPNPSSGPPVVYPPASPLSILICQETHRFCSPVFRGSGSPTVGDGGRYCRMSLPTARDEDVFGDEFFNAAQRETGRRLRNMLPQGGLASVIQGLAEPLAASRTVVRKAGGFGAGWEQRGRLGVDQWRVEVERWFEIGLVMLQMGFVDGGSAAAAAVGMEEDEGRGLVVEERGCGMQRVGRIAGVRNLNLESIIGTIAVGVFLVLLSLALEPVVGWWQRRRSRGGQTRVMQWKLDGLFQMQRAAYEAAGVRGWDNGGGSVPTTSERVFPKDVARTRSTF